MVRANAPNFPNSPAESGQTAWDALRASHALVDVSDESQIVVCLYDSARTYFIKNSWGCPLRVRGEAKPNRTLGWHPAARLADSAATLWHNIPLLFWFARDWLFFQKGKGNFGLGVPPSKIRAGGAYRRSDGAGIPPTPFLPAPSLVLIELGAEMCYSSNREKSQNWYSKFDYLWNHKL